MKTNFKNNVYLKLNEATTQYYQIDNGLLTSFRNLVDDEVILLKGVRFKKRFNLNNKIGKDTRLTLTIINTPKGALNKLSSMVYSESIGFVYIFEENDNINQIISVGKSIDSIDLFSITINMDLLKTVFEGQYAEIKKDIAQMLQHSFLDKHYLYIEFKNRTEHSIFRLVTYFEKLLKEKTLNTKFVVISKAFLESEKILKNIQNSKGIIEIPYDSDNSDYAKFVSDFKSKYDNTTNKNTLLFNDKQYILDESTLYTKLYKLKIDNAYAELFQKFVDDCILYTRNEFYDDSEIWARIRKSQIESLPPTKVFLEVDGNNNIKDIVVQ